MAVYSCCAAKWYYDKQAFREANMKNKIIWLRISYWSGAIGDFLIAVSALIPERMGVSSYCYPMGLMSAIAFSWGCMLVWADRKPVERRWILLPTILVGTMLMVANIYSLYQGVMPFKRLLPNFVAGALLIFLWAFSYYLNKETDSV